VANERGEDLLNKITDIALDEIVDDITLDPRQGHLSSEAVAAYTELPVETMPPAIVAVLGEKRYWIGGRHRAAALRAQGIHEIRATEVAVASRDEIFERAVRDNLAHGVQYTNAQRDENIRRLLAIGWKPTDISLELGFGKNTVDKIKRADLVRNEIGEQWLVTRKGKRKPWGQGHYIEIYVAPKEYWPGLTRAISTRGWTTTETRLAVQGILRGDFNQEFLDKLLEGDADPFFVDENGEVAILPDTLKRDIATAEANDPLLALLDLTAAFHDWNARWSARDVISEAELGRKKAVRIDEQLAQLAETVGDLRMALHRIIYDKEEAR
jgi:hypothetical protein